MSASLPPRLPEIPGLPIPKLPEGVEIGKLVLKPIEIRDNRLLRRKEVILEAWHVALPTPTRLQIREEVARLFGVDVKQVYIRGIKTEYGRHRSIVEAHIYDDPTIGEQIEPLYIRLRNMPREEAKKIYEEIKRKKAERKMKKKKKKK